MERKAIKDDSYLELDKNTLHDKKFIAEAVMLKKYVNFNQLPNLQKALENENINGDVWMELVFLIKKVIKGRIALTEYL
jgi:hypothetical protein